VRRLLVGSTLLFLAACAGEEGPSTRAAPASPNELEAAAFRLTIDNGTGQVTVGQRVAATRERHSWSLIGSEAIGLLGTGPGGSIQCTWSSIPDNSKQRRCTFDLALASRLSHADLVTPTSFPKMPAGVSGILVIPYTAHALGASRGQASPSPAWDNAPHDFFHDSDRCAGAKTGVCYRWELYPGPLQPLDATAPRTVGFDVDKGAESVTAFILVAADLRD
jgi:hypothetical protein